MGEEFSPEQSVDKSDHPTLHSCDSLANKATAACTLEFLPQMFCSLAYWLKLIEDITKIVVKKRAFYGQADHKGEGGGQPPLTESKCENFDFFH